jgi:hypothetical protein
MRWRLAYPSVPSYVVDYLHSVLPAHRAQFSSTTTTIGALKRANLCAQ